MKIVTNIVGALVGALFIMSAVIVLFKIEMPNMPAPPPPDSPAGKFMGALMPSGYMTMVKVFELLGGILVAIPKTRNFGLLVLGPIIVNIIAYHHFITKGEGLFSGPVI